MSSKNFKKIFELCQKVLNDYNADFSPDHYIQNLDSDEFDSEKDLMYISDVLYGCCDKLNVIEVLVLGFYNKEGKNSHNADRGIYKIITYTIMFRMNFLNELKMIARCWNAERLLKYLKFVVNQRNLLTWVKDGWKEHYDTEHVENELLNPFLYRLPIIEEYMKELDEEIYNLEPKVEKIPGTQVEPFDLTQPQPRKFYLPDKLEVPDRTPKYSKDSTASSSSQVRGNKSEPKLTSKDTSTAGAAGSRGLVKSKSSSFQPRRLTKEPTETAKIPVKEFKAKPLKSIQEQSVPVRLNTAVVLREEFKIKKQADEWVKKFEYLQNGEYNSNEFIRWQNEMKINDLKREIESLEKVKLEIKLTHEDAILAREMAIRTKREQVKRIQEESDRLAREMSEKRRDDDARKNALVKETIEGERNVRAVKEKIRKTNQQIAREVIKQSEQMQEQALRQVEEEMRKKMELIQQIKAAESCQFSNQGTKLIDLTSKPPHGLLTEMSIAELRERLAILKQEEEEYLKRKHDDIVRTKIQKDEELVDKLQFINRFRNESNAAGRSDAKNDPKKLKEKLIDDVRKNSETLNELSRRLSVSKDQAKSFKSHVVNSSKEDTSDYNYYKNQRKMLEWNRFKDLESNHEHRNQS